MCSTVFGVRGCDSENIGWRPDYGSTFSYQIAKIADFSVKHDGNEIFGVHRIKSEKKPKDNKRETRGVLKSVEFGPATLKDKEAVGEAKLLYGTYIGESVITKVPYTMFQGGYRVKLEHRRLGKQGLTLTVKRDNTITLATVEKGRKVTTYLTR